MSRSLPSRARARLLLGAAALGLVPAHIAAATAVEQQITVNQIGYRTEARKVAVLADPVYGFNAAVEYIPGDSVQVRRVSDDVRVLGVKLQQWNGGKPDTSTSTIGIWNDAKGANVDTTFLSSFAGDRVWWADFSSLTTPGDYYLYDAKNDRKSYDFRIADDVYDKVLQAAVRMFFYQRQGMDLDAKYAGVWNRKADRLQDSVATTWTGSLNPRDVRGGWWDAGDPNKYMTYTTKTLWQLFDAFENNAQAFTDATNIPESGNGVPDLLDEIKWELDWMLRMQNADGSVHSRVVDEEGTAYPGVGGPEAVKAKRHYTLASTWSSACFAAGTANASRFFKLYKAVYPGYSDTLLARAKLAWTYLEANPTRFPVDGKDGMILKDGSVDKRAGGDKDYEEMGRLLASAELFRATGEVKYQAYFDANMLVPMLNNILTIDPMGGTNTWVGQIALVSYARTPKATASKLDTIRKAFREINYWFDPTGPIDGADPYRVKNWYYSWGSNQLMSDWGLTPIYGKAVGMSLGSGEDPLARGEEYVHYLLGRNPMSMAYLTNIGKKGLDLGAERCATSMFHIWTMKKPGYTQFDYDSSTYGQLPGYLTGGPNFTYTYETGAGALQELRFQPHMKSYKDWSGDWPQNSWTITEPAIYYQAAFVNLLSHYVTGSGTAPTATGISAPSRSGLSKASASLRGRELSIVGVDVAKATLLDPTGQVVERFEIRGGKAVLSSRPTGMLLLRLEGEGLNATVPVLSLR